MNDTPEPLAPLSDGRVRELQDLTPCELQGLTRFGAELTALAQEAERSRALERSTTVSNPRRILRMVTGAILKAFAQHYPMAEYRDPVDAVERIARDFFVRATQLNMLRLAAQGGPVLNPESEPERAAWEALVAYAYADGKDGARVVSQITSHYLRMCAERDEAISSHQKRNAELAAYEDQLAAIALALGLRADAEPDAVLAGVKDRRWIAVDDVAPPQDGTRIFVLNDNGAFSVEWHVIDGFDWWFCQDGKHDDRPLRGSAPSHWMPIPANEGAKQ